MLYMIIEFYKNGDPGPVYRRFAEKGRLAPEGLRYLDSWIDQDCSRCFQLMETDNRALIDQWIAHWSDIVDFEIIPVMTSAEAARRVLEP